MEGDERNEAHAGSRWKSIPRQLWERAPVVDVPLIIGCCKDETALFTLKDEALYSLDEKGLAARMPGN